MSNKSLKHNDDSQDAYSKLGLSPGASFDEVQKARDKKLLEAQDDIILKAQIESSYDSLLMNSLKERQLGKVSSEAFNASKKEENGNKTGNNGFPGTLLTRLSSINTSGQKNNEQNLSLSFDSIDRQGLIIRLSVGFLATILLLVSSDANIQLILSLSTIGLFISQIKRGRKILQSLGWSVVFLSSGYILGGVIISTIGELPTHGLPISIDKLEALPAIILLWVGSIFLA